jgi:hypothetical protein
MTLENKLGITNSADLVREEERISKKKALELFDTGMLDKMETGAVCAFGWIQFLRPSFARLSIGEKLTKKITF